MLCIILLNFTFAQINRFPRYIYAGEMIVVALIEINYAPAKEISFKKKIHTFS